MMNRQQQQQNLRDIMNNRNQNRNFRLDRINQPIDIQNIQRNRNAQLLRQQNQNQIQLQQQNRQNRQNRQNKSNDNAEIIAQYQLQLDTLLKYVLTINKIVFNK